MFTVITGDEIVLDVHIKDDFTKPYQSICATAVLGGAHCFNAMALAQGIREEGLDGRVVTLGHISTDRTGQNFRQIAAGLGIDASMARDTGSPTLIAQVQHGERNNSFSFPNLTNSAMSDTTLKDLPELVEENRIFLMQGLCSTLKGSGDAWLKYAYRDPGMMVIYDANIRMPAIDNISDHKNLVDNWAFRASVIKISDADVEEIYGPYTNPDLVASRYLNRGVRMVCLTRGASSVVTYTDKDRIESEVTSFDYKKTVGAGDNFIAGVTLGLAAKSLFNSSAIHSATRADIAAVVQRGIDRAAKHLRFINE